MGKFITSIITGWHIGWFIHALKTSSVDCKALYNSALTGITTMKRIPTITMAIATAERVIAKQSPVVGLNLE